MFLFQFIQKVPEETGMSFAKLAERNIKSIIGAKTTLPATGTKNGLMIEIASYDSKKPENSTFKVNGETKNGIKIEETGTLTQINEKMEKLGVKIDMSAIMNWLTDQLKKATGGDNVDAGSANDQVKNVNLFANANQNREEEKAVKIVDNMARERDKDGFFRAV